MKPRIDPKLTATVEKLDYLSTLLLMGILLDHALKLGGLQPEKKTVIEL